MNCIFCKKEIPQSRFGKYHPNLRYCSTKCIKRAFYIKYHPNRKSYFSGNPDFWKTETGIGFKWEKWSAELLRAKHNKFGRGADLNWKGKLVDVKTSKLYKRKNKRGKPVISEQKGVWVFNRNKNKPMDFFFCICLIKNKPHKLLLIPNDDFSKSGIVIGWKSNYDKFLFSPHPFI